MIIHDNLNYLIYDRSQTNKKRLARENKDKDPEIVKEPKEEKKEVKLSLEKKISSQGLIKQDIPEVDKQDKKPKTMEEKLDFEVIDSTSELLHDVPDTIEDRIIVLDSLDDIPDDDLNEICKAFA